MKKGLLGVSAITFAVLYGLLGVILIVACVLFELPVMYGVTTAIVVILIQYLVSPWLTDLTMRWFYKADFKHQLPSYLDDFIKKTCEENNMKYPKIGFIDDGAPNAFTYGRTKNSSRIVITRGILELLSEEEAKAVVAHEIGHAVHYDILLMTMVQLVPFILYGVYEICMRAGTKTKSSSSKDEGSAVLIVALVAFILYIITEYIILWLSRVREYYADEFSAKTLKNPSALAEALVKIGFGLSTMEKGENVKKSLASSSTLGISDKESSQSYVAAAIGADGEAVNKQSIVNAMKWDLWNIWAKLYELNSTHPLVSKRILALGNISKELGQEPFIEFNEKKTESYVGLFIKEIVICILPTIGYISALVAAIICLAQQNESLAALLGGGIAAIATVLSIIKVEYRHPKKFKEETVSDMLGEVKVSNMTSIPCELTGKIIGRGDPGCIFNENFVIRDKTGIVLLNYKQPLKALNKIFALFRSKGYIDKDITVKGWFRRSPVPYVEMLSFNVGDKQKKLYGYIAWKIFRFVLLAVCLLIALCPYIA